MTMQELRSQNHGFITEDMMPKIVELNRFEMVLVRTGGGRFIVPAQNADHFIAIITREGSDHVRDVSFPAKA